MKKSTVGTPYRSPLTSWLWLVDVPEGGQALMIGDSEPVARELRAHFPSSLSQASPADVFRLPSDNFVCIVLAGTAPFRDRARGGLDLLRQCHRILVEGGLLSVSQDNPLYYASLRPSRALRGGRHHSAKQLRMAGFSRIDRFLLEPSHETPLNFIPAKRIAMNAHEGRNGNPFSLRRLVVLAGLGELLYPGILLLAHP